MISWRFPRNAETIPPTQGASNSIHRMKSRNRPLSLHFFQVTGLPGYCIDSGTIRTDCATVSSNQFSALNGSRTTKNAQTTARHTAGSLNYEQAPRRHGAESKFLLCPCTCRNRIPFPNSSDLPTRRRRRLKEAL